MERLARVTPGEAGLGNHRLVVRSEPENEPPGRDLVDGHRCHAQHHWMTQIHVGDVGPDQQPGSTGGHHGHRDHAVVAQDTFEHEQVVESGILGPLSEIHGLAVAETEPPQGNTKLHAHHQSSRVKTCV
jgi:hypothetical protein